MNNSKYYEIHTKWFKFYSNNILCVETNDLTKEEEKYDNNMPCNLRQSNRTHACKMSIMLFVAYGDIEIFRYGRLFRMIYVQKCFNTSIDLSLHPHSTERYNKELHKNDISRIEMGLIWRKVTLNCLKKDWNSRGRGRHQHMKCIEKEMESWIVYYVNWCVHNIDFILKHFQWLHHS